MGAKLPATNQNQNQNNLPSVASNGFDTLKEAEEVAEKAIKNINGRKMILIWHAPSQNEEGQWTPTSEIYLPLGSNITESNASHYDVQVAWKYGGGTPQWEHYKSSGRRFHFAPSMPINTMWWSLREPSTTSISILQATGKNLSGEHWFRFTAWTTWISQF